MEWIRLFHRILILILTPFALVGCVAVITAPVTVSLWLIWLLATIGWPDPHTSWYRYTLIVAIQLLLGVTLGLLGAIDPNHSAGDKGFGVGLFFLCLVFSMVIGLIWSRGPTAARWGSRAVSIVIGSLFVLGCLAIALRSIIA